MCGTELFDNTWFKRAHHSFRGPPYAVVLAGQTFVYSGENLADFPFAKAECSRADRLSSLARHCMPEFPWVIKSL